METQWLEDILSLAEMRSFSRSGQLRHITQPAFSRRIQVLEACAGIDLADCSSYPTHLTPAGETLQAQAQDMAGALHATRNLMRSHHPAQPLQLSSERHQMLSLGSGRWRRAPSPTPMASRCSGAQALWGFLQDR